ncbi:MAG: hypothetical protein U5R31_06240 [Acidimicrobiia bacterium]|nr:hypothetical protein [Acidimicrobiia bacterium]
MACARFVDDWAEDGFGEAPPMAAVVLGGQRTGDGETVVVQLRDPVLEEDGTVTFAATLLADEDASAALEPFAGDTEIDPPERFGGASLVVDASPGRCVPIAERA